MILVETEYLQDDHQVLYNSFLPQTNLIVHFELQDQKALKKKKMKKFILCFEIKFLLCSSCYLLQSSQCNSFVLKKVSFNFYYSFQLKIQSLPVPSMKTCNNKTIAK